MKKFATLLMLVLSVLLFVSFSNDPPNGHTGAPGDSICQSCHTPQNQNFKGSIRIEGFPDVITPDQTYELVIVNRDSLGTAAKGGFQMTILGPLNTRAGTLSGASSNSAIVISSGRQYFEHRPAQTFPDSNVLKWKVQWKADNLPTSGTITAYIAGNIVNGNFQSSGDRTYTSRATGEIMLSATEELSSRTPALYPNPGSTEIHIELPAHIKADGSVYFYNSTGSLCGYTTLNQGKVNVPAIAPGVYWLRIVKGSDAYVEKWIKI